MYMHYVYIHFVFSFVCPRAVDCLLFLAIENNAAVNMDVQMSAQVPVFTSSGHIARSGIAES